MAAILRAAVLGAALSAAALAARADDPPALPKPPDTPLPAHENPMSDAQPGETMRYEVHDVASPKPAWTRWFEERVLARTKDRVLLETVETDETGAKVYSVDPSRSGWMAVPEKLPVPPGGRYLAEKARDEVLYVGSPPTRAIRTTHRYREEPEVPGDVEGPRRTRQIWFSHDVPCSGRVKEHPAQGEGERMVLSWDRRLAPEECAERAKKFGPPPEEPVPSPDAAMTEPAMDDGMSEPGMADEPGMGG